MLSTTLNKILIITIVLVTCQPILTTNPSTTATATPPTGSEVSSVKQLVFSAAAQIKINLFRSNLQEEDKCEDAYEHCTECNKNASSNSEESYCFSCSWGRQPRDRKEDDEEINKWAQDEDDDRNTPLSCETAFLFFLYIFLIIFAGLLIIGAII